MYLGSWNVDEIFDRENILWLRTNHTELLYVNGTLLISDINVSILLVNLKLSKVVQYPNLTSPVLNV